MAGVEERVVFALNVTLLQRDTIRALFHHHDWELIEVDIGEQGDEEANIGSPNEAADETNADRAEFVEHNILHAHGILPQEGEANIPNDGANDANIDIAEFHDQVPHQVPRPIENNIPHAPEILPETGEEECAYCLAAPCVTSRYQAWFGPGQAPHRNNNRVRKEKYRKFWKMMADRGLWNDPRYLAKKAIAEGTNVNDAAWLPSVREIMPDCVLKFVRNLYPNPVGRAYMGHMWM